MKIELFQKESSSLGVDRNPFVKKAKIMLSSLLILSLLIYVLIPLKSEVSMPLYYSSFILMLFSNYIYFKAKKKKNYLDFDTLFILVYCLVCFSTTFVYNDEFLFRAVFMAFPVDSEYINIGNQLALIGLQAYMMGNLKNQHLKKEELRHAVIGTQFLILFIFLLCLAFFASGGITYYRSVYDENVNSEGPGISGHILLLLISTCIATIATEYYNKKIVPRYKVSRIFIGIIVFVVLLLLWSGNRTAVSQLILPLVCLYTILFRNISLKTFVGISLVGIVFMWFVQNQRSETGFDLKSPMLLILDLTIPARTTYTAFDFTTEYNYTYGKSMSLGIVGIIPLLPSLVVGNDKELLKGSAELLTDYTFDVHKLPSEIRIGLGTTILADIYLSFGLVGVIVLMFLLGYLVNRYTIKSLSLNYYSMIILGGLLANAIFLVRASYTHPVRYILWALFIAYLNKILLLKWKR